MEISKEELVVCIEKARKKLEDSIEGGAAVLRTKTIIAIFMKTA